MKLLLFSSAALAALAFASWIYLSRELPVAGRARLAVVRAAVLAVILLLLFDARLPGFADGAAQRWVLLDASQSMAVGPSGATAWDRAAARARSLADAGARVMRFGADLAAPPLDSALGPPPTDSRSLLVPALERAAEAGAREVVVLSDLRLEDPVGIRAALERLRLGVRFEPMGAAPRNAGVVELELPADLAVGEPVVGRVSVFASGVGPSDSVRLEVREEDRVVSSSVLAVPTEGRVLAIPLRLPSPTKWDSSVAAGSPADEILYRVTVALVGDEFAADDQAVAYAVADPRVGTLVAVSFAPDWELRHLLPVLARVTGLPARGFLRAGDRFLPMLSGGERATPLNSAAVAERVRGAQLVVLHGLGTGAPEWASEAAARASRALIFAADPAGALAAGLRVGPSRAGEWYLDPEPLPSPLAAALAGLLFQSLPPLLDLMPRFGAGSGAVPAGVRLRGTGPSEAPLVLRERGGGRVAVVLASGWWRWALRPGPAEEAYGRIWSGVAGWLLGGGPVPSQRLRPAHRVLLAGTPIEWTGSAADSRLTVVEAAGSGERIVLDTTLAASGDAVRTPPLVPGSYRYRAVSGPDTTAGRFDVQEASAELRHPRMAVPDSLPPPPGLREGQGVGRPLRSHPLPYLVLVALLCGEWVTRRRKGLR